MANPTGNRAYVMPASTDLVTNLPAQFATFGDAVDLDMVTGGGYQTIATAAGTTALTKTSARVTFFTGVTTQTVTLPVVSTLALGQRFKIVNKSTGAITVQSSGGNTVYTVSAGDTYTFICILITGTSATSWDYFWDGATTPPTSALIKILAASFSAVATTGTTFDGVFTSTYNRYQIHFEGMYNSIANQNFRFQTRLAGVTKAADYYGTSLAGSTLATTSGGTSFNMGNITDTSALTASFVMNLFRHQSPLQWNFTGFSRVALSGIIGGGMSDTLASDGADGFILSSASGNITGTVTVYGVTI